MSLTKKLRSLLWHGRLDDELDEEVRFHVEMKTSGYVAAGMNPREAREAALRDFGRVEQTKEECRETRGVHFIETVFQDVRFGVRQLRKNPGFTAVAVLTLALGIGANSGIFSVMRQVLLQRLPVPHPEELVLLYAPGDKNGNVDSDEGDGSESFSYPMFADLRDHNTAFAGLAAKADFPTSVAFRGQTERARAELVSGNFFETLGVHAALGRLFYPSDSAAPGGNPVVVLSHGFWKNRFGGDSGILNQSLR
jgi:putative ABC transport system permease protein